MRLLFDVADHHKFLADCVAAKPTHTIIASYGVWAGVMPDGRDTREWGEKFKSQTRELLESMRKLPDVRILIGLYEYKSCKGKIPCHDCDRKYVLDLIRHINHAEKFQEFQWRVATASHVKCALFFYPDKQVAGAAGGRNLTDSSWADVTIELDKMSVLRLEKHVNDVWNNARPLTDATIESIIADHGISPSVLETLV